MATTDTLPLRIAGKTFNIPFMPFKKLRVVVPSCQTAFRAIQESGREGGTPLNLTHMDHLYLAIYEAISFADPDVKREEFDTWGSNLQELIEALSVVALQTGVLVNKQTENASKEVTGA